MIDMFRDKINELRLPNCFSSEMFLLQGGLIHWSFFLNGAELSLNSANSRNLMNEAQMGPNLKIPSLTCVLLAPWKHPDLLHKR